jgi:hypothetical protein
VQSGSVALEHMNPVTGMSRVDELLRDLTHHVMHALGSRMWGFTRRWAWSSADGGC